MSLIAKSKSKSDSSEFVQVPVGMHLARCYRIADLGTQPKNTQYGLKHQRTVMISFEVHGEGADGQPMVTSRGEPLSISQDYNLTLNENSTLSKHLEGWRGTKFTEAERNGGFDIQKILGVWAMVNVTASTSKQNGKVYHNIDGLLSVPKMIKDAGLPTGFNPLGYFSMEDEKPDMDAFNSLSQYHQDKVKNSPEWSNIGGSSKVQSDDMNDDIPF
jgi:hypothetical protein